MALFGFSDISFNKNERGPLSSLYKNEFKAGTYRYPLDIGSADKGHYMMIYIRQQKDSAFRTSDLNESALNANGSITENDAISISQGKPSVSFANELISKVNGGLNQINQSTNGILGGLTSSLSKGIGDAAKGLESGINNLFGQATTSFTGDSGGTKAIIDTRLKNITDKRFSITKKTELTTDAIALYMPDTLNYVYSQGYSDLAPGKSKLAQAAVAGAAAHEAYQNSSGIDALKNSSSQILKSLAALAITKGAEAKLNPEIAALGAFAATGVVLNPMMELLYTGQSQFRTFQFDFFFYPRDEREALEVQKIIERLRFHQAPEISGTFKDGFLIPPSEFDIRFYYNGSQNPNIPPIGTCVLDNININYAPNGFSAYEVPEETFPSLGRTGMPVAIQLTLAFKEVSYLTKDDFNSDTSVNRINKGPIEYRGGDGGYA
jgi:hypothetical protein